jgi:hypothetical protein
MKTSRVDLLKRDLGRVPWVVIYQLGTKPIFAAEAFGV